MDGLWGIIAGWDGLWQFVFLICAGNLVVMACAKLVRAVIRSITISIRGWPPEHLDADGESIAELVAIQERKIAEKAKS